MKRSDTLHQAAQSHHVQQGQRKVTETLKIHHEPDGMLLWHRTCFGVCFCVCVFERVRTRQWEITVLQLSCRMGLEDGWKGEVERMAELVLSHSVYLGGMGGAQTWCVVTELPLSLSLTLFSSLTSWCRRCVSQASGTSSCS